MALYEYQITFQVIDTPLSEPPYWAEEVVIDGHTQVVQAMVAGDVRQRMMMVLAVVLLVIVLGGATLAPRTRLGKSLVAQEMANGLPPTAVTAEMAVVPETAVQPPAVTLSPIFAAPVRHWEPQIVTWAAEHGLDPDIVATIMQIESCGDPRAQSHAGATGLFQVMPFHFEPGEDAFDPETNAFRGMSFFTYVLGLSKGDIGRALAGYNGGPRAALSSWDSWVSETRRYYTWGTGIYADAKAGLAESPTLQQWLQAGGASLCRQAAERLGLN